MFRFFSNNSQKNVKYNFISYFNIILFIFDIFFTNNLRNIPF